MNEQENPNKVFIMKFGGSCLTEPSDFKQIKSIIRTYYQQNSIPISIILVVSALKGVTDLLIEVTNLASKGSGHDVISRLKQIEEIHEEYIDLLFEENFKVTNSAKGELQLILHQLAKVLEEVEEFGIIPYFIDYVMSFGEKLCATLVNLYLKQENFTSSVFFGEELIITNSEYNKAIPNLQHTQARINQKLLPLLLNNRNHQVIVITGFIGRNKIGYTTTLGRGGSDFTATIIGRMLFDLNLFHEGRIILWKDVPGVLSGNPEYIQDPHLIQKLNYKEAKEIAVLGAKILHPKCISIIEDQMIPIEIRHFHKPKSSNFTYISSQSMEIPIKGIEITKSSYLIILKSPFLFQESTFLMELFSYFIKKNWHISLFQQTFSQNRLLLCSKDSNIRKKLEEFCYKSQIQREWLKISIESVGIITIITESFYQAEIVSKIGQILKKHGIQIHGILQDYNGITVSIVLNREFIPIVANEINLIFSDECNKDGYAKKKTEE
ncbi:MAG: aspartate kinase [Candidatus Lokiarchaeota archaeon]|nr:aspartate kinase [Candidatus Harpocratesius repetitus]